MRKNTILATAITATLSTMNVAHAATNFVNLTTAEAASTCTLPTICTSPTGLSSPTSGTGIANYVPAPAGDKPIVYGTHLFGSGASGVVLPADNSSTPQYAVAQYTVKGSIGFDFDFRVSLDPSSVKFDPDAPKLVFSNAGGGSLETALSTATCNTARSECIWTVDVNELKNGDVFYVAYQLTNAGLLADAGEEVKMKVNLGTTLNGTIDERTIEVATSADPVEVDLESCTSTGVRVSVSSGNTEFSSKTANNAELLSPNEAVIGYLCIKNKTDVYADDGLNVWALGNTTASSVFDVEGTTDDDTQTTLIISEGQFAASVNAPGKVSLRLDQSGADSSVMGSLTSTVIDADTVTATDATWIFSNSEMKDITAVCGNNKKIPIVVKTDGSTAVNIGENAPEGKVTLDYLDTEAQKDIGYPVATLCKLRQDGTSCWLFNVPSPEAQDRLNVRITNDSTIAGTVKGTLYNQTGGEPVFQNVDLLGGELGAGATKRITNATIANDLEGGPYTWTGRGTLQITSTLPRLEILALMRNVVLQLKDPNANVVPNPLINISTGATGSSCQD